MNAKLREACQDVALAIEYANQVAEEVLAEGGFKPLIQDGEAQDPAGTGLVRGPFRVTCTGLTPKAEAYLFPVEAK